jgi:predicted ABC-type transport system involved in lysophospholipase L1 biosynthesis ATPase subunit
VRVCVVLNVPTGCYVDMAPMRHGERLAASSEGFLFSSADLCKPVRALSGGERRRVALAKLLKQETSLLLLASRPSISTSTRPGDRAPRARLCRAIDVPPDVMST